MPRDHGPLAVGNPDYVVSTDSSGKPLPYPSGMIKLADGTITTRHVILGVCQARNGDVFVLALIPYTRAAGRFQRDSLKMCRQF